MQTDVGPPSEGSAVARSVSRRTILQFLGLGAGVVAVAGATGLTWRAIDGGVFATGTGPAYAAWDEADHTGPDPMNLIRAAVLAANAHNTQPWLFTVSGDRIELFADLTRTIGAMDPLLREMHVSLGCAVENLVLAGPPSGLTANVVLLPDPADATHIATITLTPTTASRSPLFDAITSRHTNRGGYDTTRPVTGQQLDALGALVDVPGTEVVWFTTDEEKRAFSDLTVRATEAIIADPQQAADDYRWYRTDWQDIQDLKDGITIDPSGQSTLIRALAKLLPVSQEQNNSGWLTGTRDTQLPTAAAFGALVVRDPLDPAQRLQTGRVWQRMHLAATVDGLGMQPLCQIPERIDRETSAGLAPEFGDAAAGMLPSGTHAIMTFRVGYPTAAAPPSPRRPAADVVTTT
jgi:nitroreductase